MKIHPVGAEFFHADGQTDKPDEANSCFSHFAKAPNKKRNKRTSQEMNIYLSACASKPFTKLCVYSGAHAVSTLLKPNSHTNSHIRHAK
jgi:hypothetical protein